MPRPVNWRDWSGGECPAPVEVMVHVWLRGDGPNTHDTDRPLYPAGTWLWQHNPDEPDGDIIAWAREDDGADAEVLIVVESDAVEVTVPLTTSSRISRVASAVPITLTPVTRSFVCPKTEKPCEQSGCTVMYCDLHAAEMKGKKIRSPEQRLAPRPTPGPWRVITENGSTYIRSGRTDSGADGTTVAACANGMFSGMASNEQERMTNALRIAMLPEMEAAIRLIHKWQVDHDHERYMPEFFGTIKPLVDRMDNPLA